MKKIPICEAKKDLLYHEINNALELRFAQINWNLVQKVAVTKVFCKYMPLVSTHAS